LFRLDLESAQLFSGDDPVQMTPICFSMLQYFVQHPDRLISKQELLDQIWPDVIVEDGAIKGYVRKLRQVLKDDPKNPRFIETARGLGYRYIGDIEMCGAKAVAVELKLPAANTQLAIAVLAFNNMSEDPDQEYFSDGITEDIITELARFPFLAVIARHSSFAFRGEKVDIRDVGQKLGVQYVLEGSVRRSGSRVRVTAQLIDVESGKHIWAERYDRELEDIFAVQDDVTKSIVATIAAQLGKSVSDSASRKPTTSIQSYEYFLQGNRHYYRFNPDDNLKAARFYQQAIERDPQFARAYAGLANTYTTDHFLVWHRFDNALSKGLENAQNALEFDSNDSLARTIRCWALIGEGRWDEAEMEVDRVLSLKSGDADILVETGHALYVVGRSETGIALIEEAVRLNPLFPDSYRRWLGIGYYRAKRYQDSVNTLRSIQLDSWGYAWLAAAFARLGEIQQAANALDEFVNKRKEELGSAGKSAKTSSNLLGNYKDNFRHEVEWQHFLDGLTLAGLVQ